MDVLAGEYVLGVLDRADHAAAVRLHLSDPDFADRVRQWHRHFAPLYMRYPSLPPPEGIIERIYARIGQRADQASQTSRGMDSAEHFTANDSSQSDVNHASRWRLWRGLAIGSAILAASLIILLAVRTAPLLVPASDPLRQAASEQMRIQSVAQLSGDQQTLVAVLAWNPQTATLNVRTMGLEPKNMIPEIWVIPADGIPRAIGSAPINGSGAIQVENLLRDEMADGATIAMTFEDPAAAPHVEPTMPIIASGKLSAI